jgi:hypothetical protein
MPPGPQDRPLETLREETIDRLIVNYGHGVLSQEALERRLDQATLVELTRDLEADVDPRYLERKRAQFREVEAREAEGEVAYLVSVFGSNERSGQWTVAPETRAITIFGGAKLDLSDARFTARTSHIHLLCLFGGVEIYVPDQANVSLGTFCIFGGVNDQSAGSVDPEAPRIVIDGLVLFGGVDIKVRKGARKRFMELADTMRSVFAPPPGEAGPQGGAGPR